MGCGEGMCDVVKGSGAALRGGWSVKMWACIELEPWGVILPEAMLGAATHGLT